MTNGKMPYQWVTTLYFFQALPFVVVSVIAALIYQDQGMSNGQSLFLISLLTLPWALKPFFAPLLEKFSSKKHLTLLAQGGVSIIFLVLGLFFNQSYFITLSLIAFGFLAFFSSIHDIVSDGLYIQNLDADKQKQYIPIRTLFYQLGRFVIKGLLLVIVARWATHSKFASWQLFFFCLFTMSFILSIYHHFQLPEKRSIKDRHQNDYMGIVKQLLSDPRIVSSILFIFFYNMMDAQMQKMIPLYLLDKKGMNLGLSQVGDVYGVIGAIAFMLGIFIAAYLLNRWPLKSCFKALTISIFIGPLMLICLAFHASFLLYPAIILTQLTAGMANAPFMAYMLLLANKTRYPMSAYTFFTTIMALSFVFFTAISGFIQQKLGYFYFFVYLFLTSIVVILMTLKKVQSDV